MLSIIDSDSIVYMSAGATQRKNKETGELEVAPVHHACQNAKNVMLKILEKTGCTDYRAFLTETNDKTSFRSIMYPEYKGNRVLLERPVHYQAVRDYLINHWKAEIVGEIEADDAVCMIQYQYYKDTFINHKVTVEGNEDFSQFSWCPAILCGIDKDLDQIPGLHFNYKSNLFYYITPLEGLKNLYMQMLTGDDADNIPRIQYRWGLKKEHKITKEKIKKAVTEKELYDIVYQEHKTLYTGDLRDKKDINTHTIGIEERIQWLGDLLYLRKHSNDSYKIPQEIL